VAAATPASPTAAPAVVQHGPWTFGDSLFAARRMDTPALMDGVFATDWEMTKIKTNAAIKKAGIEHATKDMAPADREKHMARVQRLIRAGTELPNPGVEAVKLAMRRHYPIIISIFRQYSAAFSSEVYLLGTNAYAAVLERCGIVDAKKVSGHGVDRTEADMLFLGASMAGPKHSLNSKNTLCRFQFMQVVSDLAVSKYLKTGLASTADGALHRLVAEHLVRADADVGAKRWRKAVLFTEETDGVLREALPTLRRAFASFSGKERASPTEAATMSLTEWLALLQLAGFLDGPDALADRDLRLAYVRSMQTSKDELNDGLAHRKMQIVEFYEAVCRVAQLASNASGGGGDGGDGTDSDDDEHGEHTVPFETRLQQVLRRIAVVVSNKGVKKGNHKARGTDATLPR